MNGSSDVDQVTRMDNMDNNQNFVIPLLYVRLTQLQAIGHPNLEGVSGNTAENGGNNDRDVIILVLLLVSLANPPAIHDPNLEGDEDVVRNGTHNNNNNRNEMMWALLFVTLTQPPAVHHPHLEGINPVTNGPSTSRVLNLQNIGHQLVKFWVMVTLMVIIPIVVNTAMDLTNQSVPTSTQTFMLESFFGSLVINVVLSSILFVLSTSRSNFRGKVLFLKLTITLTSISAVVVMGFMFALLFPQGYILSLCNLQNSRIKVVDALSKPMNVFRALKASQIVGATKEIFMLKPYFGLTTVNVSLSAILLLLSFTTRRFYRKVLFNMAIILLSVSVIVEMVKVRILLKVVNVVYTTVNLFQVFKTNQTVATMGETFMLYFASSIVDFALGLILFPLSTTNWDFRGKGFFLKVVLLLTFLSVIVDMVFLFKMELFFVLK